MTICCPVRSVFIRLAGALALLATLAGTAQAQAYDFNRFLSGGGGGQDPVRKRVVTTAGAYMCLGVSPGATPSTVRFNIWSKVPQAASRIVAVAFDVGRHANLIKGVSVAIASPGVKGTVIPAQPNPFLRGMNPRYWVSIAQRGHINPEGLSPGRMIVLSAELNNGATINDVLSALHEGFSSTSGSNGLRIGLMVNYLAGGPPPGVGTIHDDGGFVSAGPSSVCS